VTFPYNGQAPIATAFALKALPATKRRKTPISAAPGNKIIVLFPYLIKRDRNGMLLETLFSKQASVLLGKQ
jgi:hypothetical protein